VFTAISRVRVLPIIAAFLVVTISQSTSFADDGGDEYPAQIILEIADGTFILEMTDGSSTIVSGTIQDEKIPDSATWELLDSSGTRHYVDFTDDLVIESETGLWNKWSFDIEINPLVIGPCACTIVVTAIDDFGNSHTELMSIFISPNTHQLPPSIHIYGESSDSWSSQEHRVNALSMTAHHAEPIFEYTFRNSSSVKCSDVASQDMSDIPDDAITLNSSQILFGVGMDGNPVGPLSFEIDLVQFSDGWYDLVLYATNPLNEEISHDCTSIRVDNTAPVALIEGPSTIPEGMEEVVIDGSSSYDLNWGIQGLTYIWSVIEVEAGSASGVDYIVDMDGRSISIYPNGSGIYEIKLAIADQAGNIGSSSQIIEVQNIAPIVRLSIDGVPISNNDEFILPKDSTCLIDASGSIDTSNDADNLRYIWRVNNIPTYEGASREFFWPEGVDDEFILTIEVIDDDSNSSMISILVKDIDTNGTFPLSIIVLILSAVFLTYSVVKFRNQTNESEIPKWT
jgi:hypothetical protein